MTLIEAMSMGVPVVSYDCDTGPRDIIKDGENGRLVRPVGDVEALANSLEELINNEMIRSQIAARAVEVRSQYSEEGIVQTWLDLFLKLLESDAQNGQGVET
ncbi:glycosyl transferase family 1 [Paraburkholderia unamae]|uniref:Glycosyl transferase family 1 n=2 Tax=Paraburkholderia unamae TaxID=219649 RepID=A0ABX5KM44_9BURK|nr:glycosyl transferase family 1 [Paraburkholderia unamae]RAR58892.1 glycosyl transferase family 1 [Paraburkholderia unamae]